VVLSYLGHGNSGEGNSAVLTVLKEAAVVKGLGRWLIAKTLASWCMHDQINHGQARASTRVEQDKRFTKEVVDMRHLSFTGPLSIPYPVVSSPADVGDWRTLHPHYSTGGNFSIDMTRSNGLGARLARCRINETKALGADPENPIVRRTGSGNTSMARLSLLPLRQRVLSICLEQTTTAFAKKLSLQ
jgi:hypothetical protein